MYRSESFVPRRAPSRRHAPVERSHPLVPPPTRPCFRRPRSPLAKLAQTRPCFRRPRSPLAKLAKLARTRPCFRRPRSPLTKLAQTRP